MGSALSSAYYAGALVIPLVHISYSSPGGVTVRDKILSKGGSRRKKEGKSHIFKM